jgi:hypothetical protein
MSVDAMDNSRVGLEHQQIETQLPKSRCFCLYTEDVKVEENAAFLNG